MVGVRERIATSMDVPGVLQTIFNVDYVLTHIAADNFVMDSSFSFASSVVRFLAEKKGIPLKDIYMFWAKVKRRSNVEVLKNYSELMEKTGLKVLKSSIPELCRYEKELSMSSRPKI